MAGRVRLKEGFVILLLLIVAWILHRTIVRTDNIDDIPARNAICDVTNRGPVIDDKSAPVRIVEMVSPEYEDGYKYTLDRIQLAIVICGTRVAEASVMLRTAVLFTRAHIHLHIFIEDNLKEALLDQLNSWPAVFKMKISITFHEIAYPSQVNKEEWKAIYGTCASQRIFLPDLLPDHHAIMYTDTDVLFLRPLDDFWRIMTRFNSTQIVSMTAVTEPGSQEKLYSATKTKYPFYGEAGVNSGVLLMNLTRMRTVGISSSLIRIYQEYKSVITYGDQDLYNIYFHYHPDQLFLASCAWNWRDKNCQDYSGISICSDGVAAFHGTQQTFHRDKNPPFKAVYDAFENWALGTDVETGLIKGIQERLSSPNVVNYNCAKNLIVDLKSELLRSMLLCKLLSNGVLVGLCGSGITVMS